MHGPPAAAGEEQTAEPFPDDDCVFLGAPLRIACDIPLVIENNKEETLRRLRRNHEEVELDRKFQKSEIYYELPMPNKGITIWRGHLVERHGNSSWTGGRTFPRGQIKNSMGRCSIDLINGDLIDR